MPFCVWSGGSCWPGLKKSLCWWRSRTPIVLSSPYPPSTSSARVCCQMVRIYHNKSTLISTGWVTIKQRHASSLKPHWVILFEFTWLGHLQLHIYTSMLCKLCLPDHLDTPPAKLPRLVLCQLYLTVVNHLSHDGLNGPLIYARNWYFTCTPRKCWVMIGTSFNRWMWGRVVTNSGSERCV